MIELIQKRLDRYQAANERREEHALREIVQEIALYGLWRAGFFRVAAFHGGTSLRVLHDLERFSEDLDFMLKEPDPKFAWAPYLKDLLSCLEEFGIKSEVVDKGRMDTAVRKALLKNDSVSNQLNLRFYRGPKDRKIVIKLEIDVNPPAESIFEYRFLDFPLDCELCRQDLSSNFALKLHALLCRQYLKGRDWYDFNWYVAGRTLPNLPHLQAALDQTGPWAGKNQEVDAAWVGRALKEKIATIDWEQAAADVERFLQPVEFASLGLWSERFFLQKVDDFLGAFPRPRR